jgi:ubiquitin carboxyl-terminal hydrolase 4/11
MDTFIKEYDGKPVVRNVVGEGANKFVEVNLLRFKAILLYPGIVSSIGGGYSRATA